MLINYPTRRYKGYAIDKVKNGDEIVYRVYDPVKENQTIAYADSVDEAMQGIDEQCAAKHEISFDNGYGTTYRFAVVDAIPDSRYHVWNIGDHMVDGYLPLCRRAPGQEDWQQEVDVNSLVAIDMSDRPKVLAEMRRAAGYGVTSLETAMKYAFAKEPPQNQMERGQRAYAKDLLPVFEELSPSFVDRLYGR